ncbi:MAG: IPT/TIG domain-containing protein, partial [Bacteroidetes bacterium]|nr:IPT/TIG domain-containing protein [Bacteroidota bacterium]
MKKIIRTFSLMLFLAYTIYSQTPPPVLYFSDITSGPKTGNSDNSLGQTPGQDGAIVTIWGRNFSSGNADVKIFCNGMQSQFIYYRGPANIGANLVPYHKMEMISFQIDNLANDGLGSIYVEVNGVISNSIPFTVRPGNIYYVKTTGNDNSGNGSWTNPWGTIVNGKDNLAPGDILYVCDGVNQTTEENFEGCVVLSSDGTPGNPKSLIVYPNATSIVGDTSIKRAFHPYNVEDRPSIHWVISKFRLFTADEGVSARTGFRVIGNFLSAPDGSSADAAIGCRGDDIYIYGNELYDVGRFEYSF